RGVRQPGGGRGGGGRRLPQGPRGEVGLRFVPRPGLARRRGAICSTEVEASRRGHVLEAWEYGRSASGRGAGRPRGLPRVLGPRSEPLLGVRLRRPRNRVAGTGAGRVAGPAGGRGRG